MTAWMIMALLGLSLTLPAFDGDDVEPAEDDTPDTPQTPDTTAGVTINGTGAANSLDAIEGATVNGFEGEDTLTSAAENTTLNGGDGADVITLTAASGSANGDEGTDTIVVEGTTDNDAPATFTASGGAGDDTITASGIGGTVSGGDAEDVITVTGAPDQVLGGAGNDTITVTSASYGGGGTIDAGIGNDTITLTEDSGTNSRITASGGEGDDRLSTQVVVGDGPVDAFDILTGGSGTDVFEMSFAPNPQASAAAADLGTIVQITDYDATEDQLIIDLSAFGVFAAQVDVSTQTSFDIVTRADGSGSDVNFTVTNAGANGPLTGTIALEGVTGPVTPEDISLVFSGLDPDAS